MQGVAGEFTPAQRFSAAPRHGFYVAVLREPKPQMADGDFPYEPIGAFACL
jgi:hypothetical protein